MYLILQLYVDQLQMASSQTVSQSEGAEVSSAKSTSSPESTSSPDPLAVKIVVNCNINRVCIIWKSILLGKVDVNDRIIKMLSESTKEIISLFQKVPLELHNQLLIPCANSPSFLNLSINLIAKITQGSYVATYICM